MRKAAEGSASLIYEPGIRSAGSGIGNDEIEIGRLSRPIRAPGANRELIFLAGIEADEILAGPMARDGDAHGLRIDRPIHDQIAGDRHIPALIDPEKILDLLMALAAWP